MELEAWLSIAAVCGTGAITPGPSLAVVVKNTLRGGSARGVACGIGHALGIGIYAFAAVAGLHVVVGRHADVIAVLGGLYLVWMGVRILVPLVRARGSRGAPVASAAPKPSERDASRRGGFTEGFLIAFLNPKIAIFFLALLGSFVPPEAGMTERGGVAVLAMVIDGAWYVFAALALARTGAAAWLARRAAAVDATFGVVLVVLGSLVIVR